MLFLLKMLQHIHPPPLCKQERARQACLLFSEHVWNYGYGYFLKYFLFRNILKYYFLFLKIIFDISTLK